MCGARRHTSGVEGPRASEPFNDIDPPLCRMRRSQHKLVWLPQGGGRLQPVLMRHPPQSYLSKLAGGGGGLGSSAGGGGLRATHYYLRHTSRVCVCLGEWGHRGMCAIIAISHLCQ